MTTEGNLYLDILLWAYKKGHQGFTRDEINKEFDLHGELYQWVQKIFFSGTNDDRPMIGPIKNEGGVDYFGLTDKGIAAAIDYIELKEAREGSKKAMYIAIASLILATIVGIVQIYVSIGAQDGSSKDRKHSQKSYMWLGHQRF